MSRNPNQKLAIEALERNGRRNDIIKEVLRIKGIPSEASRLMVVNSDFFFLSKLETLKPLRIHAKGLSYKISSLEIPDEQEIAFCEEYLIKPEGNKEICSGRICLEAYFDSLDSPFCLVTCDNEISNFAKSKSALEKKLRFGEERKTSKTSFYHYEENEVLDGVQVKDLRVRGGKGVTTIYTSEGERKIIHSGYTIKTED